MRLLKLRGRSSKLEGKPTVVKKNNRAKHVLLRCFGSELDFSIELVESERA